ncbi:MAG: hypothetical protein JW937_09555 [Candidatus Omnitrophica bacterium]|nr:hypothetical protein [Candidatus Omnitrophota bacterium]
MKRPYRFRPALVFIFLTGFCVSFAGLSHSAPTKPLPEAPAESPSPVTPADVNTLALNPEFGQITERHSTPNATRFILHLQDLHTHAEAQFNASQVLKGLVQEHGLRLVCLEGAAGLVDTSAVASFPIKEIRERVAKVFLEQGELTGAEYLAISEGPDMEIWGIETPELYLDHLLSHLLVEEHHKELAPLLEAISDLLQELKLTVYSPELRELDAQQRGYTDGSVSISKYIRFVQKTASDAGISLSEGYPNIERLARLGEMEQKVDLDSVNKEVQELLKRLTGDLSKQGPEALTPLLEKSAAFKAQQIKATGFYRFLLELSAQNLKKKEQPKLLGQAIEYMELSETVEHRVLFEEFQKVYGEVQAKLLQNENQKSLARIDRAQSLLIEAFELKLNARTWKEFYELGYPQEGPSLASQYQEILPALAQGQGLRKPVDWQQFSKLLEAYLPEVENFYDLAHQRDQVMVQHTLERMDFLDVDFAVLITGGFHTTGMMDILAQKGISYAVASPKVTTGHDEDRYRRLLSGERMGLEEILKKLDTPAQE